MFVLGSDIKIGGFRFSGVHEVRIKKSLHSYVQTATIKLPSTARIIKKDRNSQPEQVITGKQFKKGDPVVINLGYNGDLREEFRGFVQNMDLNMPLEVQVEGYSYQLRNNNVNKSWKSTTVSEVMNEAVKGTDIKLHVENDLELINIVCSNHTGAEVLDFVIKSSNRALNAFFIKPDMLWVGLAYLPNSSGIKDVFGADLVKYRLGWNVLRDNNLKERKPTAEVTINIKNKKTKRVKGSAKPPAQVGKIKSVLLQQIKSTSDIDKLKQSLEAKANYTGYEGKMTTFLQPYAEPGWKAQIIDARYKERDGVYLIESIEVIYGMSGARRLVEIGPKIVTS